MMLRLGFHTLMIRSALLMTYKMIDTPRRYARLMMLMRDVDILLPR